MSTPNYTNILHKLFSFRSKKNKKQEVKQYVENSLEEDYSNYLEKPQEYKDNVIRGMFKNTKHCNESPSRLREIALGQLTGTKKAS